MEPAEAQPVAGPKRVEEQPRAHRAEVDKPAEAAAVPTRAGEQEPQRAGARSALAEAHPIAAQEAQRRAAEPAEQAARSEAADLAG